MVIRCAYTVCMETNNTTTTKLQAERDAIINKMNELLDANEMSSSDRDLLAYLGNQLSIVCNEIVASK